MNLQDWITLIGVFGGLLAIAGYLWGAGKVIQTRLNPRWRAYLESRGRVECPKCKSLFVPHYYTNRFTGDSVARCPKCKIETAEGCWHEPPEEPEPDYS
jgi:hypothetical protein